MRLSVIIPTYHRNADLRLCLQRLAPGKQTLAADFYEVLVSDDGVQSTAKGLIDEEFPWARWIQGPRKGPAANRNFGGRMARAEWLVFTDDDCLPDPDWLAAFDRNTDGRDVLEGLTRADRPQQRLDEESPINLTGGYLWSCNFAIRKNLFLHIGGFDENFPAPAMEDCDLRERLRREGIRLHFIPAAAVMHPWRKSRGWRFWQQHAIAYQYFLRKNHPHGEDTRMGRLKVFLRHAIKVLIAGNIKFRFRGFSHSALRSLWLFMRIWQRSPGEEQNP